MSNLSPRALTLFQAHGPGPVDWERMAVIVDNIVRMALLQTVLVADLENTEETGA